MSRIGELKAACPEGFLFYSGDDATGVSEPSGVCVGGGRSALVGTLLVLIVGLV